QFSCVFCFWAWIALGTAAALRENRCTKDSLLFFALLQVQRRRIHAIAQASRRRAILEHVPKVGITSRATRFRTNHPVTAIGELRNRTWIDWLVEAWPASARIEFGIGVKQRLPATDTRVNTLLFGIPVFAGKRRLGSCVPGHVILLLGQLLLPVFIALDHFFAYFFSHKSPLIFRSYQMLETKN